MKMSVKGSEWLAKSEGIERFVYKDTEGLWTIGIGHLMTPQELQSGTILIGGLLVPYRHGLSLQQVMNLFRQDLARYEGAVSIAIGNKVLSQTQFDSLVSVTYNIGIGAMKSSTFIKKINLGKYSEVGPAILMWNKPKEIIGRRQREAHLWSTGEYTYG